MANSRRLVVLNKLTDLLKTIVPGEGYGEPEYDGYEFDLSEAVFRGVTLYGADYPETMVSIVESPRPDFPVAAAENGRYTSYEWNLLLQGWTRDDEKNPTDPLYRMMEDVERCLARVVDVHGGTGAPRYPEDYMLGETVATFAFGPGVVRPPSTDSSSRSFFYLPVRIGMAGKVG